MNARLTKKDQLLLPCSVCKEKQKLALEVQRHSYVAQGVLAVLNISWQVGGTNSGSLVAELEAAYQNISSAKPG